MEPPDTGGSGSLEGHIAIPEEFKLDPELDEIWTLYTEENEEKYFRKYIRSFVQSWEKSVCPNWELLTSSTLDGHHVDGPALSDLPDELLPALSKFLFVGKDEAEQGTVDVKTVQEMRQIVVCLTIVCRRLDNIPLVGSMAFVTQLTQTVTLLLQHLLQMESSFFAQPKKPASAGKRKKQQQTNQAKETPSLRSEIIDFIVSSCHFLESVYDPGFRWRTFLGGKATSPGPPTPSQDWSCPVMLHQETVPFLYESFETALADRFPDLGVEMLTVFGAVISGSRHNALRAISPATSKMLLKTVQRSETTSPELHISAIYCSAKSMQLLYLTPVEERQLDLIPVIQQYQQILQALNEKDNVNLEILIEGIAVMTRILDIENPMELKVALSKNGTIEVLLKILQECRLPDDAKKALLPVIINRITLLMSGCSVASERMATKNGYSRLFDIVNSMGPPDSNTLHSVLSMATPGEDPTVGSKTIHNVKPVIYLIRWISTTDYENPTQQIWLTESLNSLCNANIQNRMLCCQNGVVVELIDTLKNHRRLDPSSAIELLKTVENLGAHSISPFELKQLIGLLQEDQDDKFPYKSHVIHVISSIAKGNGYAFCRNYFDIAWDAQGITVPNLRQWAGPTHGFSFHCWLRLDGFHSSHPVRRQLYSIYSAGGNGFEAFVTMDGVLVTAVAFKKEYLAVPLEEFPLNDEKWHSVDIVHSSAKRPFGSSHLQIWIDGTKRIDCGLKFPTVGSADPLSYCQIGSPLCRGNIPALNPEVLNTKTTLKEGIRDAIKIGLPGVFHLPQTISKQVVGNSNDSHVRWTLIGLEDQLWGKPVGLAGQLGMICVFQDALTPNQVRLLHELGPNRGLAFVQGEDHPDVIDFMNKLVFFYSARAVQNTNTCPNLHQPNLYESQVFVPSHSVQDIKDVINCIGGVQILFPLLEAAEFAIPDPKTTEATLMSLKSLDQEDVGWEVLPSSSFSDWKLEQNPVSGFLTLVKNLVSNHTVNTEQLMRGGGIPIIGSLLQKAKSFLIDVNVLMAAQLMVEMVSSTKDQKLMYQIYHSILFDFRIWSKSEFHVQIGHIQYLSTLVKEDRKFFRKKFGVQFFLDVVRAHYAISPTSLSDDDCKTIRMSLFGLVKYFLQKEVTAKEVIPIVTFMLAVKDSELLHEIVDVISHYLMSKGAKDQMFLVMHESKRADLFYCLLLDDNICNEENHLRLNFLTLLSILLRSNKVSTRHKSRMNLQDPGYLGYLHLRFKMATSAVTMSEACMMFDQMALFDDFFTYQGILGLVHHLQWASLDIKLEIARRLMSCLFAKPDTPSQFAKQVGWQDCIARLLVKKMLKPELEQSIVSIDDVISLDENVSLDDSNISPTHQFIEKATKPYLPQPAVDRIGEVADNATKVVTDTTKMVSFLYFRQFKNLLFFFQR